MCLQKVSKVVQGIVKGVSTKFQEFNKEVTGKSQGSFKKVSRLF